MNRTTEAHRMTSLAARVAPEDLRLGDFVTVLSVTCEFPSFLWDCGGLSLDPHVPVRISSKSRDGGIPFKVKAICLPFVFVSSPNGKGRTMDVRQVQLVRLEDHYAKHVWRQLKKQRDTIAELCEM